MELLNYVTDIIGATPSSQQLKGIEAVTENKKVTIRSGHGTGKDAFLSWVAWWYLSSKVNAKIVYLTPTAGLKTGVAWTELLKWKPLSTFCMESNYSFRVNSLSKYDHWLKCVAVSDDYSPEYPELILSGITGDRNLILVSEPSLISAAVFRPLRSILGNPESKVVLAGNILENKGFFYATHFNDEEEEWTKLQWNSMESSLVVKEFSVNAAATYGLDSDIYRTRVEGNPPCL